MYILPYHIIIMWKITTALVNLEKKNSTRKMRNLALKMAHEDYVRLVKQIERAENPDRFVNRDSVDSEIEIDEAPISATKEIMQKTKIDSPVWRYFLRDSRKKGVVSARISKITGGKKAVWKQSKNGNKDEYVAGIEGMESDEVDKVMAQFKNLNTYFNKSAFRARIWSRQ